ncbi:hypothetical protein EDB81DRAFT_932273 [Dactylonectria macrodidyma]|uniref:Apple domain-containing protein n=1 Tax=Dactylonectria macrodidyma TaxID=307937 RepID=A0A9P9J8N8_9HYPO|nr:hypothetical protein EDB81DRAFT_932273 [Dactylonectria macrodidyma]
MHLSSFIALAAALAFNSVQADSTPSVTTLVTSVVAPTETNTRKHASRAICKQIFPQPKVFRCDARGYVNNDSSKIGEPVFMPTVEDCADYCLWESSCHSFNYRWGSCQIFGGDFSALGFFEATSYTYWYQLECFNC